MLTVALVSQKGGAGKTTIAINLAVASELAGRPAVVVDLDPQASAATWGDSREAEAPVVVSAQAARLAEVLATAREHGAALTLIDTAPHAEAAARTADLVLVPCRPSVLDLRAVTASQDIARSPAPRPPRCCAQSPRAVRSPARPKALSKPTDSPLRRCGSDSAQPSCTP